MNDDIEKNAADLIIFYDTEIKDLPTDEEKANHLFKYLCDNGLADRVKDLLDNFRSRHGLDYTHYKYTGYVNLFLGLSLGMLCGSYIIHTNTTFVIVYNLFLAVGFLYYRLLDLSKRSKRQTINEIERLLLLQKR